MFFLGFIQNVALLIALAAGLHLLAQRLERHPILDRQVAAVLFGVVGILGMMTPVPFAPGVIYDGRSIILSLAGLFCGPWALIPAVITSIYRIYLGGAGMFAGLATIAVSTVLGIGLHYLRQRDTNWVRPIRLWLFGLVVHVGVLASQVLVPNVDMKHMLVQIGPGIMLLFPLAFVIAAHFFLEGERRQRFQKALQESEARLALSIEGAELGTWDWNVQTGQTVFNERWAEMVGYRPDEIAGDVSAWDRLLHPDDREPVMRALNDHLDGKTDYYESEHRMRHKAGDWVWVLDKGRVIERAPDGRPLRACGTHLDITERRRADDALRQSTERLEAAVKGGKVGLWDWNPGTEEVYYSEEWKRQLGYGPDELAHEFDTWFKRLHPDDQGPVIEIVNRTLDERRPGYEMEFRMRHRDGTYRWILSQASLLCDATGKPQRLLGSHVDITERKRDHEVLRQSVEHNRAMLAAIPDLLFRFDREGRFLACHATDARKLMMPAQEIVGRLAGDVLLPELAQKTLKMIEATLRTGRMQSYDYHVDLTNERKYFEARMVVCGQDEVLAISRDVTDRRVAEQSLRIWNDRYQEMIDTVLEGIGYVDEDRILRFCNPALAHILEASSPEEVLGLCLADTVPAHQQELFLESSTRLRQGRSIRQELNISSLAGNEKTVLISASPRFDDNGHYTGAFLAVSDVTETRRLQDLQSRAERLETAGTIAGQVAHDFNNLLAPMMAYPEFIREDLPPDHPALEYLEQIEKAAKTIADINQDLLAMGRRGHYNKEPLNLNDIVRQACSELSNDMQNIPHDLDLAADLMHMRGGSAQIHRVISNLLHNALDAVQGGGRITVRTENYYVDEETLVYGQVPKGEYVKLTVSDTGCGIPEQIAQRIFDPFFTSKTTNKRRGSGLGLSVVDAVVKDHDAYIDLETAVGVGTSFFVYFPVARAYETANPTVTDRGGSERILIVDDDAIQRDVSSRLLERLGYHVTAVESGAEAIELLKREPHDLVILDMIMPGGIDGAETFRCIRDIYPNQKAVIASGFAESERVKEAQRMGVGAYIRKPFTSKSIAAVVRTELDRKPSAVTV